LNKCPRKPKAARRPHISRSGQMKLLVDEPKAYGGDLLKTRKGRARGRPLDTRNTMHMVLRSTKAKGDWSFSRKKNSAAIHGICTKFAAKYGVKIVSIAYVGNHLHFQIKLGTRHTYRPFVRAITGAIAMAVTGASRWNPLEEVLQKRQSELSESNLGHATETLTAAVRFWDRRPFTRTVTGRRGFLTLNDYIKVNQYQGAGYVRSQARFLVEFRRAARAGPG
jgi:REP element-mobilizing transposase RayT